jgi:hypothetical protein
MLKIYVAINYRSDYEGRTYNLAFLNKQNAQDCVDEGFADSVLEIESEDIGWMKKAADSACQFNEWAAMGTLELSTLAHGIEDYEKEIYHGS